MEATTRQKKTIVIVDGLRIFVNFFAYEDQVEEIWEYYLDEVHDEEVAQKNGVNLDSPEDYVDTIPESDILEALKASKWQEWEDM